MAQIKESERPADPQDDQARFEALVEKYGRRVYAMAYRMAGHEADAKDLAQEAFIRVWRSMSRLRPGVPLEGWLYRIVTNLFIDLLRRRRGPRVQSLDEPLATASGDLARERADHSADVERAVLGSMLDRRVQQALLSLPPEIRMVVVLADVEGYAYEEIASMMGIPVGTVKSRLHRARLALRGHLAPVRDSLEGR